MVVVVLFFGDSDIRESIKQCAPLLISANFAANLHLP